MRNILIGILAWCVAMLPAISVAEEVTPPSPIVKTAFVVDAPLIGAEDVVWAGVTFTMPEHWHIYWQNPGDSGIPTRFEWQLPEGLTAGDIAWPTPERLEMSGLVTYGYNGTVTLLAPLTATRAIQKQPLTLKAHWLVCHEICVPESAEFSVTLPTRTPDAQLLLEKSLHQAPSMLTDADMAYRADDKQVSLMVASASLIPTPEQPAITQARFFPIDDGVITNDSTPAFKTEARAAMMVLQFTRGSGELPEHWNGVLQLTYADGNTRAVTLVAQKQPGAPVSLQETPASSASSDVPTAFWITLLLAFVGGLILNIMPCVLPILALKALALAKKAESSRAAAMRQGIAYTIGVVMSFLLIAGAMLALKASGQAIGWGFQLQQPAFVAVLAIVMLAVAANLMGLFEVPVLFGNRATRTREDTLSGSVLTGALAVLVATPCTAPFMATAIGATLALPTIQSLLVFAVLGFGMAAPFLLISVWPAARRLLPKPGMWMIRFKQFLALPMLATAGWLFWVLWQLLTPHQALVSSDLRIPYSAEKLSALRAAHQPVLVDATAAWCLSCKVNERVALNTDEMQAFFREHQVMIMVADWTQNDPAITAYLAQFKRSGVPLYVYYPPEGEPKILPQILTPASVRSAIAP